RSRLMLLAGVGWSPDGGGDDGSASGTCTGCGTTRGPRRPVPARAWAEDHRGIPGAARLAPAGPPFATLPAGRRRTAARLRRRAGGDVGRRVGVALCPPCLAGGLLPGRPAGPALVVASRRMGHLPRAVPSRCRLRPGQLRRR